MAIVLQKKFNTKDVRTDGKIFSMTIISEIILKYSQTPFPTTNLTELA